MNLWFLKIIFNLLTRKYYFTPPIILIHTPSIIIFVVIFTQYSFIDKNINMKKHSQN